MNEITTEGVSVLAHISSLMVEMDRRYEERFTTQSKQLDTAFTAQQTAMTAALAAAEKAVATAMIASEKAVTKAEVAAEKRFDNVNEFRALVNDIMSKQMPRVETEQQITALSDKIDDIKESVQKNNEDITAIKARTSGMTDGAKALIAAIGVVATVLVIVAFIIAL